MIGEIASLAKEIVKRVVPDKTDAIKAEAEIDKMQVTGELQARMKGLEIAESEAKSSDPWTSRARPSFFYVFYFLVICLTIIAPFVGIFYPVEMHQFYANVTAGFEAIPSHFVNAFLGAFGIYAVSRTVEKVKKVAR